MSTDHRLRSRLSMEANTGKDFVIRNGFPALFNDKGGVEQSEPLPRSFFASFENALLWNQDLVETLQRDCETVFTARTKEQGAAYSAGCTYFCPCEMKPQCGLEALALDIFHKHVEGLPKTLYRPEQSGAEWWTLVLESSPETTTSAQDKNDEDDDEDDDDDEVGLHFDADYGLEAQVPNLLLHPRLATVTYLSDVGAPTLVLDRKSPPVQDAEKESLKGNVSRGWLSQPAVGKHIGFDGRLLHGAPATFFPPARQERAVERAAKRVKMEQTTNKRISFLVNIWLNHCPLDAEVLEEEIAKQLKTPWDPKPWKWGCDFATVGDLQNVVTLHSCKEDPAGSEETVLCDRYVTVHYGDSMKHQHEVSRSVPKGGSIELSFEAGALSIQVGAKAEDDESDGEEEAENGKG